MTSIFSINFFWILFIVNQIVAEECVQKGVCECNYADGFGYDLRALDNKTNFEANSTSNSGIEFIFRPCTDSTILPDYHPLNENNCNSGFAVMHNMIACNQ